MRLSLSALEIRKKYNGIEVLRGLSYSFAKNGVYVLTGPNGSGKSTLLRICALLETPDSGRVEFSSEGSIPARDISLRRRMTLVLPKGGLFNDTVFNNVAYGLRLRGINKKKIREIAGSQLESYGLKDKARQNALTLSSGEAQRLAMARATAIAPEILFLDEPTASVDRRNCGIIEEIILGMKDRGSPMVIMTTHDMKQAERLADVRLALEDGVIVAC